MDRALVAVDELAVGLEVGAARAVVTLVVAVVYVARVVDPLQHVLDGRLVLGVAGADEEVVRRVHPRDEVLELRRVAVDQLLRGQPLALRGLRDRLAVLVGAREEEHLFAALAHVAREDVRRDRRVRVPEMGLCVHVIDGGGDVVGHGGMRLFAIRFSLFAFRFSSTGHLRSHLSSGLPPSPPLSASRRPSLAPRLPRLRPSLPPRVALRGR